MPIFLSQTYVIVTHESIEYGDIDESGFEWENVPYTFREVVELIHGGGFTNQQCSEGVPRWLTSDVIQDRAFVEDGEHRILSLHPNRDARSQRYWEKACRAAGVIK